MKRKRLLWQVMSLVLVLMFLLACGLSRPAPTPTLTPVPPTSTSTPVLPTSTSTPVPPPSTPTSASPTATAISPPAVLESPTPQVTSAPTLPPIQGEDNGHIIGQIRGAYTGNPQADLQVILCLLPPGAEGPEYVCTLQAEPTARSDADGAFQLLEVLAGTYVLVYGPPEQVTSTVDEWEGVQVTRGELCTDSSSTEYVCESSEYEFWAEGGTYIAGTTTLEIGEEGVVEWWGLKEGIARSNRFGILIMVEDRVLAPIVEVEPGEITQVEWQLRGPW
jgi:hypothetical protein